MCSVTIFALADEVSILRKRTILTTKKDPGVVGPTREIVRRHFPYASDERRKIIRSQINKELNRRSILAKVVRKARSLGSKTKPDNTKTTTRFRETLFQF